MSEGQVNDDSGVETPLGRLPDAEWLIADRNCDAEWFREILKDGRQQLCIPGRKSSGKVVRYDKRRYRIEMMFGRPKGPVPHCNPLWSMPQGLPFPSRPRRNRHVLALTVNEPGT